MSKQPKTIVSTVVPNGRREKRLFEEAAAAEGLTLSRFSLEAMRDRTRTVLLRELERDR